MTEPSQSDKDERSTHDSVPSLPSEFQNLADFYQVESVNDLVRAQAEHIERLQAKLPRIPDQFPRTPREG